MANHIGIVPEATAQIPKIILEMTTTTTMMLFLTTTTATLLPATTPAAMLPLPRAPALACAAEAQDAATVCNRLQRRPQLKLQQQQDIQTPQLPAQDFWMDAQSIQSLATTAPGPPNAVKGSLPGTRMAKPRFKAVCARMLDAIAPAATAADVQTIHNTTNLPTSLKGFLQKQTVCSNISSNNHQAAPARPKGHPP